MKIYDQSVEIINTLNYLYIPHHPYRTFVWDQAKLMCY